MRKRLLGASALALAMVSMTAAWQASPAKPKPAAGSDQQILDGFRKSTVASVADAVDQITGERGFMSHDMRPRIAGQIVGRAVTALLRQTTSDKATAALSAGVTSGSWTQAEAAAAAKTAPDYADKVLGKMSMADEPKGTTK